jgi:hydroxyacylglutathione hydrolase
MRQKLFSLCLIAALGAGVALAPARAAQGDGVPRITLAEFKALLASPTPPFVIDVRAGADTKIKGAHVIPLNDIEAHLNEIPRDRPIVTYCS